MNHIFEHQELIKSQIAGTYLQKGAKVPVGTISDGYKKVAEGKWQKVSEHGMTKKEHTEAAERNQNKATSAGKREGEDHDDSVVHYQNNAKMHQSKSKDLDDKEYGDAEVMGTETKFERGDEIVVGKFKMDVVGYEGGKLKVMNKQGEKFTLSAKQTEDAHKQLHPKENKEAAHPVHAKLDKFLSKFPDDASSWKQASGEIADMHQRLAEYHNDMGGNHEMRKEHSKTPADHNQYHKKNIKELIKKIPPYLVDHFEKHYSEWLNKGEDTDDFMTPLEHQEILKSQIAETFEKGGKAAVLGEKRTFGGKDYIKTSKGWRPVGKSSGKVKEAHDAIHGTPDAYVEYEGKKYKAGKHDPSTKLTYLHDAVSGKHAEDHKGDKLQVHHSRLKPVSNENDSLKVSERADGTFSVEHKESVYYSMPGEDKEAFKKRAAAAIKADHPERGDRAETEAFKNNHAAATKEQREHVAEKYFGDKNKDLTKVGSHHHDQLADALYEKIEADKKEPKNGDLKVHRDKNYKGEDTTHIHGYFEKEKQWINVGQIDHDKMKKRGHDHRDDASVLKYFKDYH